MSEAMGSVYSCDWPTMWSLPSFSELYSGQKRGPRAPFFQLVLSEGSGEVELGLADANRAAAAAQGTTDRAEAEDEQGPGGWLRNETSSRERRSAADAWERRRNAVVDHSVADKGQRELPGLHTGGAKERQIEKAVRDSGSKVLPAGIVGKGYAGEIDIGGTGRGICGHTRKGPSRRQEEDVRGHAELAGLLN